MLQTSSMEAAPDSTGEVADEITPLDGEGRKAATAAAAADSARPPLTLRRRRRRRPWGLGGLIPKAMHARACTGGRRSHSLKGGREGTFGLPNLFKCK